MCVSVCVPVWGFYCHHEKKMTSVASYNNTLKVISRLLVQFWWNKARFENWQHIHFFVIRLIYIYIYVQRDRGGQEEIEREGERHREKHKTHKKYIERVFSGNIYIYIYIYNAIYFQWCPCLMNLLFYTLTALYCFVNLVWAPLQNHTMFCYFVFWEPVTLARDTSFESTSCGGSTQSP